MRKISVFVLSALISINGFAAMYFDGSNDYVDAGNGSSLNGLSKITISMWVMWDGTHTSEWIDILSKETSDYESAGFGIRKADSAFFCGTANAVVFVLNNGSKQELCGAQAHIANQWTHVAGTYDGATMTVYRNGTSVGTRSVSGSITNSANNLNIGRRVSGGDRNFPGSLDDIRIYNRALSATEIENLCQSRNRLHMTDGLIGYWRLDEGVGNGVASGATALDRSGNANTGTPTNGPVWITSGWLSYP